MQHWRGSVQDDHLEAAAAGIACWVAGRAQHRGAPNKEGIPGRRRAVDSDLVREIVRVAGVDEVDDDGPLRAGGVRRDGARQVQHRRSPVHDDYQEATAAGIAQCIAGRAQNDGATHGKDATRGR